MDVKSWAIRLFDEPVCHDIKDFVDLLNRFGLSYEIQTLMTKGRVKGHCVCLTSAITTPEGLDLKVSGQRWCFDDNGKFSDLRR